MQIANTETLVAPVGSVPGLNARPAHRDGKEYITIYCTGLGDVTNRPASGAAALVSPLSWTVSIPSVTIGGQPANVTFWGLAPGFVGLYQVNALVPDNAPVGDAVPLVVTQGNIASNTVTIAIQ